MQCSKCGTEEGIEQHHLYPRVHFGNGRKNYRKIALCHYCHSKLETIIMACEMFVAPKGQFGRRYRLQEQDYMKITRGFLHSSKHIELVI